VLATRLENQLVTSLACFDHHSEELGEKTAVKPRGVVVVIQLFAAGEDHEVVVRRRTGHGISRTLETLLSVRRIDGFQVEVANSRMLQWQRLLRVTRLLRLGRACRDPASVPRFPFAPLPMTLIHPRAFQGVRPAHVLLRGCFSLATRQLSAPYLQNRRHHGRFSAREWAS